ncbi:proto-oncogene tyrosine-protein kinase ros [Lasius niger]|uniref:receptor protein-tyrosine kinase n=1 Tax=Lasius niger TaxID=67767 RepID=A0A0J7KFG7_LASNI|nr:proto-oncogene tyrosine-protein kinase ros [Lasius niger]
MTLRSSKNLTCRRLYEFQNLTPFTEYKLKLALSNFYVDKLSMDLQFGADVKLTTTGKLNAPEDVTVQVLTPTLAVVHWMPPKKLNCVAVNYEVHWELVLDVLFPKSTQKITYQLYKQLVNQPERTVDGKFFTIIRPLLPGQKYLIYMRVYPTKFSNFFTDSSNKSFYMYSEPNNLTLNEVSTNAYRQRKEDDEQVLPPIMTDMELAILHEIPIGNFQFNTLYNPTLPEYNPDDFVLTKIKREQITLAKLLGSGAFGMVFQGRIKDLEGPGVVTSAAIKMLRKNASSQEKKKFLQEARLMNHFRHKHVLRLLAVCLNEDSPLLVLELMEIGDLLKYLRESRKLQPSDSHALRLQDLLIMCEDVARGCSYLEKLRFVHRDLTCRNCLVSARDRENRVVKIGDFGLARDV